MRRIVLAFVLVLMLAVAVPSCMMNDPRGFAIFVSNASGKHHAVAVEGSHVFDFEASSVTLVVPPHDGWLLAPFVDLEIGDGGDRDMGRVIVMSAGCALVAAFDVPRGDYSLQVGADGSAELAEVGILDRPTEYGHLREVASCDVP